MFRTVTLYLLFSLIVLLQANLSAFTQTTTLPVAEWKKKLNAEKDSGNVNFLTINETLYHSDSIVATAALTELEKSFASSSFFFKARFYCLKAIEHFRFNSLNGKVEVKKLFDAALQEAYQTGDTNLISLVSWRYGVQMYGYKELELAATYCLKAVELNQDFLNQAKGYAYAAKLGEILFHCREYEKCIFYTNWSIANWSDTSTRDSYSAQLWNTIGQAYQELGMLDSALVNYERSMLFANKTNVTVWKAINSGFMGQVFFLKKDYEKAKPLLEYDYSINKDLDLSNAAYSLQWLARINLIQGKKDSALKQVKESLRLLEVSDPLLMQNVNFRQYTYATTADVYKSMGKNDSFYRYFQLYTNLHDSLERVIAGSSIEISELRIDNEKNIHTMQVMQREKQAQIRQRNLIIAAIVFLAAVTLLLIIRQRLKLKYRQQLDEQEKLRVEQEVESAMAQLKMFTQNIVEKTILIEKLEQKVKANEYNADEHQIIEELSHQTILTEDDWLKFKTLFEKTHPDFFTKLKEHANDITLAEQRMAALTRLRLTTKQMAAVLGISPNSVIKAKQRLRQRFNFQTDFHVEEFLSKL
jgi:tetratricopeptide (TPR) repeat protein/DNA-binding CsgD family transcriptional regulator